MVADFIYQQQLGILVFLGILCLIALFNLLTIERLGKSPPPIESPMVSILVPARNEAHNIEICLVSLLNQEYGPYEVVVLNDESQDATEEILARLSHEYPRLVVLSGQPLPPGWIGKNWACHQLSQAAQGDLLLFVDADTRHQIRMLPEAVATLITLQADLLSGMPHQDMKTWGERLTLPVLPWAVLTFFPVRLIQHIPISFLSIAVGQFIVFRRAAYDQIGGHAAVQSSVIEDLSLARLAKKKGLRWEFINLSGYIHSRMYENFGQVIDGLSKNLFAVFGHNLLVFLFVWFWLAIVFLLPVLTLLLYFLGIQLPGFSPILAMASIVLSLISWLISDWFYEMPLTQAATYPVTIAFTWFIAMRATFFHYTRRSLYWKGRPVTNSRHEVDI
jgi:chlorobactene glucosyltransferase